MKSLAREGDSDAGGALWTGCSVPPPSAAGAVAEAGSPAVLSASAAGAGAGAGTAATAGPSATADRGTTVVADPSVAGSAGCWLVLMTQTLRPATDSERHTIDPQTPSTA